MPYYIYGLVDPRKPSQIRYIGQSRSMDYRLYRHCSDPGTRRLRQWLVELKSCGLVASYVLLGQTEIREEALKIEKDQIALLQPDLNVVDNYPDGSINQNNPLPESFNAIERKTIIERLVKFNGNKLRTAKSLGIGRQTLYNKIKQYRIDC